MLPKRKLSDPLGHPMRPTAIRILKHGIPAALVLAALGYGMAEVAGLWVSAQQPVQIDRELLETADAAPPMNQGDEISSTLRTRLPFTMAAWGFGLVAVLELLRRMVKGDPATTPPRPPPPDPDAEVEKLLNQLLEQAEAAKAAREAPPDTTPIIEPPPP